MKKMRITALLLALVTCIALFTCACSDKDAAKAPAESTEPSAPEIVTNADAQALTQLGHGEKSFIFKAENKDGTFSEFVIHTDEKTVGDALSKIGMIFGEEGQYGLYVNIVNGYKAEYETDGKYWAFYVNGTLAETGVDSVEITEGAEYMFKTEAAK